MAMFPITVCRVETPEGIKDFVTCLPHQIAFERGLISEAIIGVLAEPVDEVAAITPAIFTSNHNFVEFMHAVIFQEGLRLPGLIAEARKLGHGWVYIIDQRTRSPHGDIPPEDIIGVFAATDGCLISGSYKPNPKHLILSTEGFFQLGTDLELCLLEELGKRV